jgi:hypothetical protein
MRIASILMSALLGAGLIVGPAWATAADDPHGVWIDDKGRGGVEIKDCGANLCGHIVWAKDEADNGWIYDPDSGKRYDVELKVLDEKRLRVKGYAGAKFFSRSMIWTRAPDDLKRCDASATKATDAALPGAPTSADAVAATKPPANTEPVKSAAVTAPPAPSAGEPPAAKPDADAGQPKPNDPGAARKPDAPRVAAAEYPDDPRNAPKATAPHRLRDLKFGDGYGVTPTGGGNCRLRVPYFSMNFRCED